jgi:hypothetical protein
MCHFHQSNSRELPLNTPFSFIIPVSKLKSIGKNKRFDGMEAAVLKLVEKYDVGSTIKRDSKTVRGRSN